MIVTSTIQCPEFQRFVDATWDIPDINVFLDIYRSP